MPRTQISIKLDTDLLKRIDQFASEVGVTRTAVIEKALKNDLPEQEAYYESLENPIVRGIHQKLTSPTVLRALAKIAQQDMTDEEIREIVDKGPRQREAAKKRAATKKQGKKNMEGAS
jgi:metal-responsive CopG/Arc/MetJ family transcriptional regulator